ncbi:MAG: DUF1289 domain-containing protein [Porticoccaceae bacterium]|nr:DUF1289 domain-containing protein [Porticoccaceae bacterium]MDG1473961.1 DUF1289 domain-containing protein [Porticoccaceae bacterium]
MKKYQSPCVDICRFSGPKSWCVGCGRSRQESQKWKSMKSSNRKNIQLQLKDRMAKITLKLSD